MTSSSTLPCILVLLAVVSPGLSHTDTAGSVEDLTYRMSDFGTRVFRSVARRTDDNVFLSPFTLSAALTALLSATDGPTQDQLLRGLGLSGLEPRTIADLIQALQNNKPDNLRHGVAVFPAQDVHVSSSYLDLVQTKFSGTVQNVAFTSPEEAAHIINRWAQDQTEDQDQELVSNLDSQTQLLLAAVASYKAHFSPAFNASLSQEERFYVDSYHVVMVTMMTRAGKYFLAYDRSLSVGVLKLAMTNGAAMLVVLPDEGVDVVSVEEDVTAAKIQAWIQQLKKTKLEVQLPRFLLERSYSLKDVLQSLDITQVFDHDADMTNMGGVKGPRLTQVFHKSVISVDERSNDVTAEGGDIVFSTPPPRLTINRPFVVVVYQETTGSLLCVGRVLDPTNK
ncbi:protein Z-dependent protease inhibitor-like [Solea solea]|uniref:protein Z-dependent protease inhibitor-like n=1 Tax=Solea solea TaxID=90069 RepID=UPI00272C0A8A|nr:protein Z-dependent protease inhibitor-like [Solea solea]